MPRADELLDRARLAASSGNYPRATRYLEQVDAAAHEPYVAARAEITRAYVEAETGNPAGAVQRCLDVLARDDLDPVTEGKAWQQLGLIRMRTGETDAAMEALARAIAVLPPGSDDLGYALINRGNVHLQHGRAATGRRRLRGRSRRAGQARARARPGQGRAQPRLLPAAPRRPRSAR